MILHLLDDEKFTERAIELFESAFPHQNIYLVGKKPGKPLKYVKENPSITVKQIRSKDYKIFLKETNYSFVLIHGLDHFKQNLLNKGLLEEKNGLFLWGAELYNRIWKLRSKNYLTKTKRFRLKNHFFSVKVINLIYEDLWDSIREFLGFKPRIIRAFEKIDYILTNIKGDYELLLKFISTHPENIWFTYVGVDQFSPGLNDSANNILIGNSATYTNNHLEVFDLIKKSDIENRKLIVPLSYGDQKYGETIQKEGTKRYGENFMALMNYMPLKEYQNIFDTCSVVLFNHVRQQGVGNITMALYSGKKVFLREENTVFQYFKQLGAKIFLMNELSTESINEPLTAMDRAINKEIIEKEFDTSRIIESIRSSFEKFI